MDEIDLSESKLKEVMNAGGKQISMDAPMSNEDGSNLLEILPNTETPNTDNLLVQESLKEEIGRSLEKLGERDRNILKAFSVSGSQR